MLNPHFWTIESVFNIVHSEGLDDEDENDADKDEDDADNNLKKVTLETIIEAKETLKSFREDGIKLDVTPTFSQVANSVTSTITTAVGVYGGTKIAASVANPMGKAAVIAGTVVITAASKAIVEEISKNQLFPKIKTESSNVEESPPSPTDTNFTLPSVYEPEYFDSSSFLPGIESTDSLQKVLENLLLLSELNIFFLIILAINIIFIFIDFEKSK